MPMTPGTPNNVPPIEQMLDEIMNQDGNNDAHTRLMERMQRDADMARQQTAVPTLDDPFGTRGTVATGPTTGRTTAINNDELRRMHEQMRVDAGARGAVRGQRFDRNPEMQIRTITSDEMIFQLFENRQDILEWLAELANEVGISLKDTLVLLIDEAIKMNESEETDPMLRELNRELNSYKEEGDGTMDEPDTQKRSDFSGHYRPSRETAATYEGEEQGEQRDTGEDEIRF